MCLSTKKWRSCHLQRSEENYLDKVVVSSARCAQAEAEAEQPAVRLFFHSPIWLYDEEKFAEENINARIIEYLLQRARLVIAQADINVIYPVPVWYCIQYTVYSTRDARRLYITLHYTTLFTLHYSSDTGVERNFSFPLFSLQSGVRYIHLKTFFLQPAYCHREKFRIARQWHPSVIIIF